MGGGRHKGNNAYRFVYFMHILKNTRRASGLASLDKDFRRYITTSSGENVDNRVPNTDRFDVCASFIITPVPGLENRNPTDDNCA